MIPDILNTDLIKAVGMTLLHSLWQVVAVYIIMRIVLSLLKGSDSRAKYNISVLALFTVLVLAIVTFTIYRSMNESSDSLVYYHLVQENENAQDRIISYPIPQAVEYDIKSSTDAEDYLPWFVLVYLAGVIILALRLLTGIIYLRRYRYRGIAELSLKLEELFDDLLKRIRISKKVKILESLMVQVPFVIGYFKPVVIVPAGIMANLPFNQVEAILAHELAHIRRHDFLVNIVQSIVELLFFFHPVIYLISKNIRIERENCCDDIALRYCNDSTLYVKALASMEKHRLDNSYHAVAFVKKRNNLLERIKRILNPNVMKTKLSHRIFAGMVIILGLSTILITGAAALNNLSEDVNDLNGEVTSINLASLYQDGVVSDSIIEFDDGRIITHHKNSKGKDEELEMVFEKGELVELYVDGKEVPKSEYSNYREVVKTTLADVRIAQEEMEKAKVELADIDEEELRLELEKAMAELENIDRDAIMMEVQQAMDDARAELAEVNMEEIRAEVEAAMADIDMEEIRAEIHESMEEINWEEIRLEIEKAMQDAEIELNDADAAMNEIMADVDLEAVITEAMQSIEGIDWDLINESVQVGLDAAMISLENLDDIVGESLEIGLGVATEVLENLDKTVFEALKGVESIDTNKIMKEIEKAKKEVDEDSKKLDELEKNMEQALEQLEKEENDKKK